MVMSRVWDPDRLGRRTAGGIIDSGHRYERIQDREGLFCCLRCNCAEGTLPKHCPGVKVPYNVQTMIYKGVVDYVNGRWVGGNRPSARVARSFREATLSLARLANTSRAARMGVYDVRPANRAPAKAGHGARHHQSSSGPQAFRRTVIAAFVRTWYPSSTSSQ